MPPREKILIVEDDNDLGSLYRTTLMRLGFQVAFVRDGIDALRYLDQNTPDLVILDLGLPKLRGEAMRDEVRAHAETRDIPIVIVTGQSGPIKKLRGDCVLRKPANLDRLVATVQRCLRAA